MKFLYLISILGSTFLLNACSNESISDNKSGILPPIAEKMDTALIIHGDERIDPYFWIRLSDEQKNAESPDEQTQKVLAYLKAENRYKDTVMKHTEGFQDKLFEEIKGRIKQDDESVPYFKKGYWYITRFEQDREYPIYTRKKESLEAEEQVLLNVNELAEGYDYYSASGRNIDPSDKIIAYGEDTVSRRIYTLKFLNLETREYLPEEIQETTGGGAWSNDGNYFFYTSKNPTSLLSEKIWRHEMGTDVSEDVMVYQEKDPSYYIGVYKSKSDKFLIIYNSSTLVSDYHILNADNPTGEFRQFTPRGDNHEYNISHFENKFYIRTNLDAKNFRLMETPDNATEIGNWTGVIPHREDVLLDNMVIFKNHMVLAEREKGLKNIRIINQQSGEEHYLEFEESAYVAYTAGNPEFDSEWLRFGYQSMTTPGTTFDYNMNSREKVLKKQQEVVGGHDPNEYYTERIYAPSRDGKQIPMSVVYKKGLEKNGSGPLLLYAYGSYGSTIDPYFSSARLSLLDRGFAFAYAHVRGGQMLGREWYDDGRMLNKKNTFNDFVDCAKYLIEEKYTSSDHLYAQGGSAGGLLMGAIANMNPELFNGIMAAVPWVDVVTTMLDASIPLTSNEFDEWGNPNDKEYYEYMLSYSPYDQVKPQDYPNMLITTGFFDSQVQYWEPVKWTAKLRAMNTGEKLIILDCNMESGHGGASGRFKRLHRTALVYAFFLDLEGIYPLR
jgi:oligopeptidase B